LIIRQTSGASVIKLSFGDDADAAYIQLDPTGSGIVEFSAAQLLNNINFAWRNVADSSNAGSISSTIADNFAIAALIAGKGLQLSAAGTAGLIQLSVNAQERIRADATTTAGQTAMLLWDVDNAVLERVTVGAIDSGGSGFKVLRIAN
jgi:hypothetical protein